MPENSNLKPPLHKAVGYIRRDRAKTKLFTTVLLLIVILGVGFLGGWLGSRSEGSTKTTIDQQKVVLTNQGNLISSIAQMVDPSVVTINVTGQAASTSPLDSLLGLGGQTQQQQSAGTGIILNSSGLILTCRHVVPVGTTSVSVTLADGTTYNNVQVIGRTSQQDTLDVAFLKIPNTNGHTLVPAQLGDSNKLQIGDTVIAIGNALGQFQNTVTSGIISGFNRSVQASDSTGANSENLDDLIQTDAAINEGNSGGPLVNLDGQVIGVNAAIAGNAENIGFAMPINDLTGLINGVESSGKLEQPYLGVIYIPLNADVASQYNLSVTNGAYIPTESQAQTQTVIPGGPAGNAGLQGGDIITQVNGTNINQSTSLAGVLDQLSVGQKVNLNVLRGGKEITITVTLGNAPTS